MNKPRLSHKRGSARELLDDIAGALCILAIPASFAIFALFIR